MTEPRQGLNPHKKIKKFSRAQGDKSMLQNVSDNSSKEPGIAESEIYARQSVQGRSLGSVLQVNLELHSRHWKSCSVKPLGPAPLKTRGSSTGTSCSWGLLCRLFFSCPSQSAQIAIHPPFESCLYLSIPAGLPGHRATRDYLQRMVFLPSSNRISTFCAPAIRCTSPSPNTGWLMRALTL